MDIIILCFWNHKGWFCQFLVSPEGETFRTIFLLPRPAWLNLISDKIILIWNILIFFPYFLWICFLNEVQYLEVSVPLLTVLCSVSSEFDFAVAVSAYYRESFTWSSSASAQICWQKSKAGILGIEFVFTCRTDFKGNTKQIHLIIYGLSRSVEYE